MLKTVKRLAAKIVALLKDISDAFFNLKEGENIQEKSKKVASTVTRRIIYGFADYGVEIFIFSANVALKALGIPLLYAFIAMWIINILVAGIFMMIYFKTGHDVSLGEDLRRGVDAIHKKSLIAGRLSMLGIIIQASVWSGPEQIIIFFKKEIGNTFRMVMVMLFLTAIQTIVWMFIYRSGYDFVKWLA